MKTKSLSIFVALLAQVICCEGGQATNTVNIATNIVFYLTSARDGQPRSQFNSSDGIQSVLLGTSTNIACFRRFPSGSYDFHLFGDDGKEVPKSKKGVDCSDRPNKPTLHDLTVEDRKFEGVFVNTDLTVFNELFRPEDIFVITNKGVYYLEVSAKICVIMTNGLPDYSAMIDGRNALPSGYRFANDFGILESPPLRVKIIKE